MEMPDVVKCGIHRSWYKPEEAENSKLTTYHHDRIVQSLRRENEELKFQLKCAGVDFSYHKEKAESVICENEELQAKLNKAKDALRFYSNSWVNQSYGSDDGNPSRRLIADKGQRARTTLEEIE